MSLPESKNSSATDTRGRRRALLFVMIVVAVLSFTIGLLLPPFNIHPKPHERLLERNIAGTAVACDQYAQQTGVYPPVLWSIPNHIAQLHEMAFQDETTKRYYDWLYFRPDSPKVTKNEILLASPTILSRAPTKSGLAEGEFRLVAYVDCSTTWLTEHDFQKAIKKQYDGER